MKPLKIVYKNQKEVHDYIIEKTKYLLKEVKEAYLIGSLASGCFGRYVEEYEGYLGSDIDLVVLPRDEIPKDWRYKGEFHNWYKSYNVREINIENTAHPVNLMVPFNEDIQLFWNKAKELNWKVEKLK
ncbi:nucleotidyltransferase domain-containing protein [Candidatus Pacearchaeota archaeon]|nr:nucleotidyltransferase domain-containing protein [Candidatus Pacearchaeota archaeon]HIJ13587.1 nucleotidyltransferase domain-containing protein [Candidatus Woesearchaeota archaeon]